MNYYKKCKELDMCHELDKFWESKDFISWVTGYKKIANETGYALAYCQVGYAYMEGIGVEKNFNKAFEWTREAAIRGDRDGQFNLGYFYENGFGVEKNMSLAKEWYKKAALQNHDLAKEKLKQYELEFNVIRK